MGTLAASRMADGEGTDALSEPGRGRTAVPAEGGGPSGGGPGPGSERAGSLDSNAK